MTAPLEGVRVLDFTKFLPGPYCTWMLADLGAEVIRVEHPRELAKQAQVFGWDKLDDAGRARIRAADIFARGKRSLLMDPGANASRPAIEELVRRADILVEDYRPGVLASMGYGYDAMRAINPRLIYASVTLCGQTGPYSSKPGHDPVALAVAGALSRTGENPDRPGFAGIPAADLLTGSNAVIGILAALIARGGTGSGQQVDIAMSDSAMAFVVNIISRNPDLSKAPPRGQHRIDSGIYRTLDGRFIVATDMEPRYWQRFCDVMGRPDFAGRQSDKGGAQEMRSYFDAEFAKQPLAHWIAVLEQAGTQFAPVNSVAEALEDPHNIARGMALSVDTDFGPVRHIGSPIHLSETPTVAPRPARPAGADTDDILKEIGYAS